MLCREVFGISPRAQKICQEPSEKKKEKKRKAREIKGAKMQSNIFP